MKCVSGEYYHLIYVANQLVAFDDQIVGSCRQQLTPARFWPTYGPVLGLFWACSGEHVSSSWGCYPGHDVTVCLSGCFELISLVMRPEITLIWLCLNKRTACVR